ncbi:TetR/AcrR family transcriptional regulator C-terminal domain-containing protein [Gluconacetobacter sacchari]|nr:TetR/AcrR family transcriptional regulator C-terminal domain-containing protein [Gluconacetobacter sacchari]
MALTVTRIVDAALAIVDEGGLRALTMRSLGACLGVEAMSLYHHVRNRDALLDLLVARVLAEAAADDAPVAGDWRAWLTRVASRYRQVLKAHPGLVGEIAVRPVRSPAAWQKLAAGASILEQSGFSRPHSFYILDALGMFVIGHVLAETGGKPAQDAPRIGTHDEIFVFGLATFLQGCGARADSHRPSS